MLGSADAARTQVVTARTRVENGMVFELTLKLGQGGQRVQLFRVRPRAAWVPGHAAGPCWATRVSMRGPPVCALTCGKPLLLQGRTEPGRPACAARSHAFVAAPGSWQPLHSCDAPPCVAASHDARSICLDFLLRVPAHMPLGM